MEELSIKIKIGDREYPMRVQPSDEQRLRAAGRLVNEKVKGLRDSFGIDDKQDLLAMVAFDCMVEKIKAEASHNELCNDLAGKISNLDHLLAESFSG